MVLHGELLYQHFQAGTVTACSNILGAAQIFPFQPALPRKAVYAVTLHVFAWHSTLACFLANLWMRNVLGDI